MSKGVCLKNQLTQLLEELGFGVIMRSGLDNISGSLGGQASR